jgi:hypothetical protein
MAAEDTIKHNHLNPGDDDELIASREALFEEAKTNMEKRHLAWRTDERNFKNDMNYTVPLGAPKLQIALIHSTIKHERALIADHLPTFDVTPKDKDDEPFADMMQRRKVNMANNNKMPYHLLQAIEDSLIYSVGLLYIGHKQNLRMVVGEDGEMTEEPYGIDLIFDVKDPYTWYPAPGSTGIDIRRNCRYVIFATPMHVDTIKLVYGEDVPAEGWVDEYEAFVYVDDTKVDSGGKANMAIVKECYMMQEDMVTYPNGRATIWCGKKILEDRPLGIVKEMADGKSKTIASDYNLVPYRMIGNYKSPHSIVGMSEPQLIITLVKILNEVLSAMALNIKKCGNIGLKVTHAWYQSRLREISGNVNEPIVVENLGDVEYMIPPSLPASSFTFIEVIMRLIDTVTGVQDVTQGKQPTGITAASAIGLLQEAAQTMVRDKTNTEIGNFVVECGEYAIWLIQNYDTTARNIMVKEGGNKEYYPFDPVGRYDQEGQKVEKGGKTMAESRFDVEIVAGQSMPSGRMAKEEIAKQRLESGVYGIEDYLVAISEPNKQEIIDNWYKRQGLLEIKQRQEAINEVWGDFTALIEKAFNIAQGGGNGNGEQWIGSWDENELAKIVDQFPELIKSEEFTMLPVEYQKNILIGLIHQNEEQQMVEQMI